MLLAIATMLAVVAARLISRRWNAPGDPVAALARNPRMLALTRLPVARAATGLRRSLAGADPRAIQPAEAGLALGRLARSGRRAGPAVYAGWRDTIVAFMAPGSGKTTAQAIPLHPCRGSLGWHEPIALPSANRACTGCSADSGITLVHRAIQRQFVMPSTGNPRSSRRSDDGQTILRPRPDRPRSVC